MKTILPLGKDPPTITSMCFNHNGKILAAAATDGMIHMFGILVTLLLHRLVLNIKSTVKFLFCSSKIISQPFHIDQGNNLIELHISLIMEDMSAGLQITGWPAHDSAVSSVLFGPDETSIFSLGTDGKVCVQISLLCLHFPTMNSYFYLVGVRRNLLLFQCVVKHF